jgi:hypothetical protein
MAAFSFYANANGITHLAGSGLGFFGSSFGTSINVGEYQTTSWLTDANGTIQGPQADNIKWTHPSSGSINGAASVLLTQIPNYLVTVNPRFTHSSAVQLQNTQVRIFDRTNINNNASGVTTKLAEIVHPPTTQTNVGSGSSTWLTPNGSSSVITLAWPSPGMSGLAPNGPSTSADRHDFYFCISVSPDSVGSKLFALYLEAEYL